MIPIQIERGWVVEDISGARRRQLIEDAVLYKVKQDVALHVVRTPVQ